MKKNKTFLVTTPIYYPSGNLHIGHLYSTTIAWVLRNYKKMQGYDTKFLTGSDEHGQKIAKKAQEANLSEIEYVDAQVANFIHLWKEAKIDYDVFTRTTEEKHKKIVQTIFSTLLAKGVIYIGKYKGLYSIEDEEFFTKTQAIEKDGEFYSPISNHKLIEVEQDSYFLENSKFEKWLLEYIESNPNFIIPKKIVNELKNNFILKGLEDLSVTRNNFKWGINILENQEHIIYVWIDALSNYITALNYSLPNDEDFQKFWVNGDEIVHVVGKEITRFHCIYWPIILKALDLRMPTTVLSHGWLITPEGKMSKSKGNVIDPLELFKEFSPEAVKYFLVSQIYLGNDGVFSYDNLLNVYNANLVNNYGNLVSRSLTIINKFFTSPVKFISTNLTEIDQEILDKIKQFLNEYIEDFDNYQIDKAIKTAISLSSELNNYIEKTMPWSLKDELPKLEAICSVLLNGIYAVATMLHPILWDKNLEIAQQLGFENFEFEQILNFNKFDNIIAQKKSIFLERKK